jgi:hypothetical protein
VVQDLEDELIVAVRVPNVSTGSQPLHEVGVLALDVCPPLADFAVGPDRAAVGPGRSSRVDEL